MMPYQNGWGIKTENKNSNVRKRKKEYNYARRVLFFLILILSRLWRKMKSGEKKELQMIELQKPPTLPLIRAGSNDGIKKPTNLERVSRNADPIPDQTREQPINRCLSPR